MHKILREQSPSRWSTLHGGVVKSSGAKGPRDEAVIHEDFLEEEALEINVSGGKKYGMLKFAV